MGSICSNVNITVTDKLFGDDVEKAIKTARETYKIKTAHMGGQRHHPYKCTGHNRSFLGQTPRSTISGETFTARGREGNPGTREG